MDKNFYRDQKNGKIAGVCAGISEYFAIDVTIIRLLTVLLGITGPGVVLYLIAMILIPNKPYKV
jgi:phage shock protein PspC (stress-responsive transcriptional regulator)